MADPIMTEDADDLPNWLRSERAQAPVLRHLIGDANLRRLIQLLSDSGGLTPTEAREWFDYDRRAWKPVEDAIACGLFQTVMFGQIVPKRLVNWLMTNGDWDMIRREFPEHGLG